jgi:dehydrogenase/reductase SDR family protein 7B
MGRFDDRVIWITGASSGIGAALAGAFAAEGARLVLSARREDTLVQLAQRLNLPAHRVMVLALDLEQPERHADAAAAVLARMGRIDVMVHNAGVSQRSRLANTELSVIRRLIDVNYFGTVSLTQHILPVFKQQGGGQFVIISSMMGLYSAPLRGGYSAAKHALHGYFEALRAEEHDAGIRVTMICPGFVQTDVSVNALTGDGTPQGTMDQATAAGLSPEYVARRVVSATARQKLQVALGGWRELLGWWLARYAPRLHALAIRKIKST